MTDGSAAPAAAASRSAVLRARLFARPGTRAALLLLGGLVVLALAAPVLPLPPPHEMRAEWAGAAPGPRWEQADALSLAHAAEDRPAATALRRLVFGERQVAGLLGSDALGRDLGARILWGARPSLLVAALASLVALLLGVGYGLLAGLAGGRTDRVLMRLLDALWSVPLLFVVILLVAILREEAPRLRTLGLDRTGLLLLVIGAVSWLPMARIVRGQALALRGREFVTAARALGVGPLRLGLRHVLPNLSGVILVTLTLNVPRILLLEAFLGFLGLGVEPPGVSWGLLVAEGLESLTPVSLSWWLVVFPGGVLALFLGALNLLGDSLRDALDPRTPT